MFTLIIFLFVKSLAACAYGGKDISEKGGQAHIRGFLPLIAFFLETSANVFILQKRPQDWVVIFLVKFICPGNLFPENQKTSII